MKKICIKTVFLQMTFVLLAAAALFGCGRDGKIVSDPKVDAGDRQNNQAMGRYAESEFSLPEGIEYDTVLSFQNGPEGQPLFFTKKNHNGVAEFKGYLLTEDLTWEEKECGWLNRLGLEFEYLGINITYGEDQKLYAVYWEQKDEELIARRHVVVTEDWDNGTELQIPVLSETSEIGYAYYPDRITALNNGNLLFDSGSSLFLYDSAGQSRIAELPSDEKNYFVHDNQFYIIDGNSQSLILYDGENGTEKTKYPLIYDDYYSVRGIVDDNGDVSLISQAGVQILKNGSDIWEQIIDGKRNTMSSPKHYLAGFAKGRQEDYFVYYNSMDEISKLARYVYDADMPVEPETELTIFSLHDNLTIKQAITEFQIQNPNVKIDFQPLMEDGDVTMAEDYVRTLNTELLAGKGPDILILDQMAEASYIEKGVLEDITAEIESLVLSGDFLANIADGSRVDGKIYSVPVKIGLPMTFGRKEALKEAGQLASLADLVQNQEVGQIFGTVDRDTFLSFYGDAFFNKVVNENGIIQEQELKDFLTNMKKILDGSRISDETGENRPTSIWGLLEKGTYLYSKEVAGFFMSEDGISIMEQARGELEADMISINQTYVPYGTIGINKAGNNKDIAIQFLQTALSEEVQRSDFYDGFAVNKNALDYLCGIDRSSADAYGGSIDGIDGNTYEWRSSWPSEPQRRRLVELCSAANNSAGRYWKEKRIMLEYSAGYFDGTESLEKTTDELMSKLTRYLQE